MPTYSDTVYTFSMSIEGQSLFFKFYWNSRSKSWHMDIKQADLRRR
ncbi:phage baseplate plug protein [Pseudomonas coronafaciens]